MVYSLYVEQKLKSYGRIAIIKILYEEMGKSDNPDYQQVAVQVPRDIARQFKAACSLEGVTMSEVFEELVTEWLKKQGFPK